MTELPQAPAAADVSHETVDPTHGLVTVLSRDLFFGMRIRTTLRQMGYAIALTQDVPTYTAQLVNDGQMACLGLIDFNNAVDWEAVKDTIGTGVPTIAFGPHTDVEGFRAAKSAGVARVISNGEFSRTLPDLVTRYSTKSS